MQTLTIRLPILSGIMAAAGPSRAGRSTLERDGSEHSDGQLTLAGLAAGSSKAASKSKANQPDPKGKQRAAQTVSLLIVDP